MIDSLMHPWGELGCIYAFPPFVIVHRVLQKFIEDKAEGILIVPYWTTKPWFTVFANLIVSKPFLIPVTDDVLFLPFNRLTNPRRAHKKHSLAGTLQLVAAYCTTDTGKLLDFRQKLSKHFSKVVGNQPENCIVRTWINGKAIVSKETLIPFMHL